jgi:predicted nucleotidyltransferase
MAILDAALEIARFLEKRKIPYAVLGGLAVQYFGEPRNTVDVDLVVLVRPERTDAFFEDVVRVFPPRLTDAVSFAKTNRILLVRSKDGTPIDISLGIPGYEEGVMKRAISVPMPGKRSVQLIGAEDLIIHKCVAGRARDLEDVQGVLIHQKLRLDFKLIRRTLDEFRPLIYEHDVRSVFEEALTEARKRLKRART